MKKRTHVSLTEAKKRLGEFVKRASYGGERIVLDFRGKPQAAIVGVDDLDILDRTKLTVSERQRTVDALARMTARWDRMPPYDPATFDVVDEVRKLRYPDDDDAGLRG
jgi:prevent-host-death family protein